MIPDAKAVIPLMIVKPIYTAGHYAIANEKGIQQCFFIIFFSNFMILAFISTGQSMQELLEIEPRA